MIDAWGDLTNMNPISGKALGQNFQAAPASVQNQLNGFCNDAAGNLVLNTACPQPPFTPSYYYDAENRLVWTSGYRYVYDGNGERVEKCQAASATTACLTSGTTGTLYWRGTGSDTLAETDLAGNDQEEYLFFNGQRIARRDTTSTGATIAVHYYFSDHLGTHGVVESATGTTCEQDIDYYPYGGVEHDYCANVAQNYKFASKERDAESGLDNFEARYLGSSLGRFMSPDLLGGHLENPQSLNKYAYVLNNPLSLTDPTGLDSYLQCTQTKDNLSTCQSQTVGYDENGNAQTATVQGVTNADKSFTATQIGNDANGNLVDKTTGTGTYTASVNGSGVQFSNNEGQSSSTGVFVNGTPQTSFQDAGWANGGALSGFSFTLTNSKIEANQSEAGFFTYRGTVEEAGRALEAAGFGYHTAGFDLGYNEYRSSGQVGTGANAGHFAVNRYHPLSLINPLFGVPTTLGNMHFGEHNPFASAGAAWDHLKEQ